MSLSRHFTLDELTHSNTAKAEGIPNTPGAAEVESLRALCNAVLDPLRDAVGREIKVNSGYRGPALNARLKGAAKSQHLTGQAADIQSPGMSVIDLFKLAVRLQLPYDQIIYEVNGASKWVHISHDAGGNAGEILLATFDGGRPRYERINAQQALDASEPVTRSRGPLGEPGYIETADEPPRFAPVEREAPAAAAPAQPAAKKPAAKKPARKKPAAKKTAAKKATIKKATAKKATAKKAATKKAPTKKTAAKKAAAKRATTRKAAAKKPAAKKAAAKKPTARKATAKKAAPKKTSGRKPAAKKPAARKATARKATASKPAARKSAATKRSAPKKAAPRKAASKATRKRAAKSTAR